MSHIAVDLKVIEVLAPGVARASGVSEDRILAGLLRLWHRCWSTKSVVLSRIALASVFGADGIDLVVDALVDSGFLETLPEGWRVKGSERYLRLAEARSKGGKAASANLIPGGPKTSTGPRLQPRVSRGSAEGQPSKDLGSTSALSPSTEHRAPNTKEETSAPAARTPRESDLLVEDFKAVIGSTYAWQGAKDGTAFADLRKHATLEEVRSRWRRGLAAPAEAWASCRTVAQLKSKWNDLAQARLFQSTKAPVAAESVDWSTVTPGEVDL